MLVAVHFAVLSAVHVAALAAVHVAALSAVRFAVEAVLPFCASCKRWDPSVGLMDPTNRSSLTM